MSSEIKDIVNEYTDNEALRNNIFAFLEMRKKKKKPVVERGLKVFLKRLDMFENDELKNEAMEDAIANCWNTVYDKRYPTTKPTTSLSSEKVNHPSHYNKGIETIDYIESWNMNFNEGNVVKYTTRAKYKENQLEDLKKAKWYIEREIERVMKGE